jgi:hypothetical protein
MFSDFPENVRCDAAAAGTRERLALTARPLL